MKRYAGRLPNVAPHLVVLALALGVSLVGTQLVLAATPEPNFNVTPAAPLPGQSATFTATHLKSGDSVSWDFNNDGIVDATGKNASYVFATPGQYPVLMRVTSVDGEVKEVRKTVRVDTPPTASFTASPNPATVGETVQFNATASSDPDGTISRYDWDLDGNGSFETTTGSTPTAARAYATTGTVNVKLRVTDNDGATAETTVAVVVDNHRPIARFTASPNPALVGQSVTFDAAGSADPDGTITSYAWDLDNDGQFDDASGVSASHSFAAAGTYTVRLSVTDDRGAKDTATLAVTVGTPAPPNQLPVASFTASPNPATVGQAVTFDASRSSDPDGTIASYAWDLDNDGQFDDASGAITSRSFGLAGTHTVRLSVTDNHGAKDTATLAVTVNALPPPPPPNQTPVASFTASPNPATVGQAVTFDASGSSDPDGTIASYAWDLDNDGQFDDASGAITSHSFALAGTHTVRLSVTDNHGAKDTATVSITVSATPAAPLPNQPPSASFSVVPAQPLTGDVVAFASTSADPDGTIASEAWDLDNDGEFDDSFSATATRSFESPGEYTVRLRATDATGATDVESQTISVLPRLVVVVQQPLSTPFPFAQQPSLTLITPFPIVRLVARLTGKGANVRLLLVRGVPRGATVTVRCRRARCRLRTQSKSTATGRVRFRSFERPLRAGTSLQVLVTQPGKIGKYTSFRIRRLRAPVRRDLCLLAVGARPRVCPSS